MSVPPVFAEIAGWLLAGLASVLLSVMSWLGARQIRRVDELERHVMDRLERDRDEGRREHAHHDALIAKLSERITALETHCATVQRGMDRR